MGCGTTTMRSKNPQMKTKSTLKDSIVIKNPFRISDLRNERRKGLYTINEVGASKELSVIGSHDLNSQSAMNRLAGSRSINLE